MILRFLFYGFLFYLAYKLVFDFIIPIYKTTSRVKKSFRQMQEKMQQHTGENRHQSTSQQNDEKIKTKSGDYIDFEEIK